MFIESNSRAPVQHLKRCDTFDVDLLQHAIHKKKKRNKSISHTQHTNCMIEIVMLAMNIFPAKIDINFAVEYISSSDKS